MSIDFTSTASVRAVLGVSEKEIRDDVLLDPIYSVRLTEGLRDLNSQISADYLVAVAVVEAARTATQQRFVDLVQSYSAYYIANVCLGAVSMFAPTVIKDSRSELQRNDDPYKTLRTDVPASLAWIRSRLLAVYALINPSAAVVPVARIMALASPLGASPVTG